MYTFWLILESLRISEFSNWCFSWSVSSSSTEHSFTMFQNVSFSQHEGYHILLALIAGSWFASIEFSWSPSSTFLRFSWFSNLILWCSFCHLHALSISPRCQSFLLLGPLFSYIAQSCLFTTLLDLCCLLLCHALFFFWTHLFVKSHISCILKNPTNYNNQNFP